MDNTQAVSLVESRICTEITSDPNHRGAADRRWCWKPDDVLRIRFLSGDRKLHKRVIDTAKEWMRYANIQFAFDVPGAAEIRIDFNPTGGSWSYVGTSCLSIGRGKPTMNLGWLTATSPETELRRVVLHEFGHVLGLIHEHSSPVAKIPWNEKIVLDYYKRTQGWSHSTTKANVLLPEFADAYTEFDPDSIMMYPIPSDLTIGGFSVPWENSELSDLDKKLIGQLYPKD